jgi:hypothetical protein
LLRLAAARLNAASLFQINMLGASDSRGVIWNFKRQKKVLSDNCSLFQMLERALLVGAEYNVIQFAFLELWRCQSLATTMQFPRMHAPAAWHAIVISSCVYQ